MPPAFIIVLVVAVITAVVLLEFRGDHAGRRIGAATGILLLAGTTAYILTGNERDPNADVGASPTPAMTVAETATPTPGATATATAEPIVVRYEAALSAGGYTLYRVDATGDIEDERPASFDAPSMAPVDRVEAPNGLVHWRTVVGAFAGLSYVPGRSGPFDIREIVRWPDGTTEARLIDPES